MSLAIAHYAIGVSGTVVLLFVAQLYGHRHAPFVAVLGGILGMVPDIHWVVPHAPDLHSSVVVNVFFAHGVLDTLDPTDSKQVAALCILVMCLCLLGLAIARDCTTRTPERATPDESRTAD